MKKFFAILLVIVLSLSLVTPVFAAKSYDLNDFDNYDFDSYDSDDFEDGFNTGLTNSEAIGIASIFAIIAGFGLVGAIIGLAITVLTIVAMWKIFVKAGEEGWKSIIPIYNTIVLFKVAGLSPWLVLIYLSAIIPIIGGIAVLVLTIILYVNLAKAFGKDGGFAVGLILLNTVFILILGLGDSVYLGNSEPRVYSNNYDVNETTNEEDILNENPIKDDDLNNNK